MFVRLPAPADVFFDAIIQCHKNITTIWICLKMVGTGIPPKKTLNRNKHMKQYDCPMDLWAPYFSDKLIFQLGCGGDHYQYGRGVSDYNKLKEW